MKNISLAGTIALACAGLCSAANAYVQHNLVSDLPGMADHLDACLVNPWGITSTATSPFWVSSNHTGLSTIYDSNGGAANLIVSIPGAPGDPAPTDHCGNTLVGAGEPTGIIVNGTSSFLLGAAPATFMFASEDGLITGWNGPAGKTAVVMADRSGAGAIYKGLAMATRSAGPLLYAADFANGKVDVFDGTMNLISLPGAFTDPQIPAGFAPFNVQNIRGSLYVTYAKQDANHEDDVAGPGNGYVDIYDLNGLLLQRLISGGPLNSPWGMALAPDGFGDFSGALLVGNFGNGVINAFDPATGIYLGQLQDGSGAPIRISGLWGLTFGNGTLNNGDTRTLYFTAGIAGPDDVESHGLLGAIQAGPAITPAGVVNAASFSAAISPGGYVAIFGTGLSATTRTWAAGDFVDGKLPVQLDGISVTINGKAAYVYYVSPGQIDAIAPADTQAGPVPVIVTNKSLASGPVMSQLQGSAASFFAAGKYAIATHADGRLIGPPSVLPGATPAAKGETIAVYGTGFGQTNPAVDGLTVFPAANFVAPPAVTIGGLTAKVTFAGRTAAGLDQINVTIPALPASTSATVDVPIGGTAGASATQPGLLLTVQSGN